MPTYQVATPQRNYPAVVERGAIECLAKFLPPGHGRIFLVSTRDVWHLYGERVLATLGSSNSETLFFTGGEDHKRLAQIEQLAGEMAETCIIDRGSGIEPKLIETIFNPFVTTKPNGVGLGLAIVSRIVDRHGGRMTVESQPGEGSVFHVILPL